MRTVLMQRNRIRRHRLPRGVKGGKFAHRQPDSAQRFLRGRVVNGGDGCNRLAAIAHAVARQHMFGAGDRQHAETLVAIGTGHDRLDAGQLRSLGNVDLEDFGVRIRTAENPAGKHSGHDEVGGVFGAPGNLFRAVDHRHVTADVMRGRNLVHGVNPAAHSDAACFTASMILT
jgi:hypothetical protein